MNLSTPTMSVENREDSTWIKVAVQDWHGISTELFAIGFTRCEWLKGVHMAGDTFDVYLQVSNPETYVSCIVVTNVNSELQSICDIYLAADFHERECAQMLGIKFIGRENIEPAFHAEFEGFPLRRDFALAERINTPWPGQIDPEKATRRRPVTPPGVHKEWTS